MSVAVVFALILAAAMIAVSFFTWFFHDQKHRDLDSWVDYGFSRDTLRHALAYYRFMGTSMLVFFVLFTVSCLMLQAGGNALFVDTRRGSNLVSGHPIAIAFFAADLVLRGGFFDIMEHFELSITHLHMNRKAYWFVWYCFVFRMYYGLTLIKIAVSFVWIWTKINKARKAHRQDGAERHL